MEAWPLRRFADAQGLTWRYRDNLRAAPALVLLPGALGTGDMAFKLAQGLGDAMRTLSITYPSGAAASQLAKGLGQLLDHLGLERVAVWGSSYGAWWAQAFALQNPARVDALWLGNMPLDGGDVAALPLFSRDWLSGAGSADVMKAWHDALAARPDSELRRLQTWMLAHGLEAEAFRLRLLQVAHASKLPAAGGIARTVVFDCADDPLLGVGARQRVRDHYPQARHLAFEQGGHYPHITRSDELIAALRRWLAL